MTQASQGTVIWSIVIATIVMLLASLFVLPTMIGSKIGDADIPTADEIAESVLAGIDIPEGLDNAKLNELYEDHFKEDNWEDTAIALATEELEDDDYEALTDWMLGETNYFDLGIPDFENEDDLEEVIIKDTEVVNAYADDEDANVYFKLKAYFETDAGDEREYIYVRAKVRDGDVDNIKFNINPYPQALFN